MESMKRVVTGLGLEEQGEETGDRMAGLGETEKCKKVSTVQHFIFIESSTRISFSKTPALTLSCLGLCTQNTLYKNAVTTHLLNCHFSFCFQEMYH